MEYRYRDKAYLSSYVLDTSVFDEYDFLVEDAEPVRSVYVLTTDQGHKIFKRIDYSLEELNFLYDTLNSIRKEYPYIVNFKKSIHDKHYIEYNGGIYVVLDLIEGRECLFENPIDLKKVVEGLAKYHSAAQNIKMNFGQRNNLNKLISRYKHKIRDLENYKKIASMHYNKSEFDSIYLEYADYYIGCSRAALEKILSSSYKELCDSKRTLCHHDLAHHNILIGNDDNVYFIDFDYAVIDLPYHDISNLITKAAKNNGWCPDILDIIIETYKGINGLTIDELEVLYGFMLFPLDFYEISSGYYARLKDWEEDDFVDKLRRKAGYKEEREEFLKYFMGKWIKKN